MRRALLTALVLVAALLGPTGKALAWGPQGHQIIIDVALARLKADDARLGRKGDAALAGRFERILAGGDGLLVEYTDDKGKPQKCAATTAEGLVNWPDCVRYSPQFKATAQFHFDDIAVCTTIPPMPPLSAYCKDGMCGSKGLGDYLKQLTAADTSPRDRAIALAFVIHIVGDLHQPLHAEDNNDAGGNSVTIALGDKAIPGYDPKNPPTKLHGLWDTPMVIAAVGIKDAGIATISALANKNASKWHDSNPDHWVAQSHAIAQLAYQKLQFKPPCGVGKFNGGTIDAAYVSFFAPKVRDQLGKAAVRLSDLLTAALAQVPDSAAPTAAPELITPPPAALVPVPGPTALTKSPCAASYLDGVAPELVAQAAALGLKQICYTEYAVGYSITLRDPLWSGEHLTRQMAEGGNSIGRLKIPFAPDSSLTPAEQGTHGDYTKQGYDRGHMTPADDASSLDSQRQTFTVTNIVPQAPYLNEHLWQYLEASVNQLAENTGEVWVITGPIFGPNPKLMNGRIAVPDYTFKAIYVPSTGVAVAYLATNDNATVCKVISIAELEKLAGIDPFPTLSDDLKSKKPNFTLPHGIHQTSKGPQTVPLPACA